MTTARAGRVGDISTNGPASSGSPNVIINDKPALRVGDASTQGWEAIEGAATVLINDQPVHRSGDMTKHGGGTGSLVTGSPNVLVAESDAVRETSGPPHQLCIRLVGPDGETPVRGRPIRLVSSNRTVVIVKTDETGHAILENVKPQSFDVYLDGDFPDGE